MKYTNEEGKAFHVDIASAPVSQDITSIRMSNDNLDGCCELRAISGNQPIFLGASS